MEEANNIIIVLDKVLVSAADAETSAATP